MASGFLANGQKKLDTVSPMAITDLVDNLQNTSSLHTTNEELSFLNDLLKSKELNALVHIHNKILTNGNYARFFPVPVLSNSMQVLSDVLEVLINHVQTIPDCKELFHLLQVPHIQGLLCAHDSVAQKDYYPHLPDLPMEEDDDNEETVKIVQLVKSNEPLTGTESAEPIVGATIKSDDQTGRIVIARIMRGGAADRSGLIHTGDEVVEVNAISVEGKTPADVLSILQNSEGTITFKLIPAENKSGNVRESKVRVRAYFDYDSTDDILIPCKEAGLDFKKGDVLHVVSQDDQYWWQARKEGDKHMRAGLIPSRALQEKRVIKDRAVAMGIDEEDDQAENDDFDREMIPTYEEVAKLYPRPGVYRPIVLIGPPGVGRNELKRRLIDLDRVKYRTPVPYTSRAMKPGEVDGKEYFFVKREFMEDEIEKGKFIEFGEYKGNLYGTSANNVKKIINDGHVCVLNPHYQALKILRTTQLKPFIIYIKPPPLELLKETREVNHARSTFDVNNSRGFTEDEFKDMIAHGERIEFLYSHYFDEIIENNDLISSFSALLAAVRRVETEPLWVPASWVQ